MMPGLTKKQVDDIVNYGDEQRMDNSLTIADVRDADDFRGKVCHIHDVQSAKRLLKRKMRNYFAQYGENIRTDRLIDECFNIPDRDD